MTIHTREDYLNYLIQRNEDLVELAILHENLGNTQLSIEYGRKSVEVHDEFMRMYHMQ